MTTQTPNQFQNGIIDVFKVHRVFDLNIIDCLKKGDVSAEMVSLNKLN
ncbi:MAG: hypothetical protein MJ252_06790 [archaeon]|nr:hypothetical protein [archaeon]